MLFKDENDFSLLPKCFFMTVIFATILLTGYLMFVDIEKMSTWLKPYVIEGDFLRQAILMFCLVFYFLRLSVTVFVFLKRKMVWLEMILVTVLMSFVLFSFASVGGANQQPVGAIEFFGILLYMFGSYLNTYSEYTRYIWKKRDKNKGKLYTEGLFKYSMHINYFGDVVLFTGFALITNSFSMLVIPLIMALNFLFFIIPSLDKYLQKKYGKEFDEYAKQTKKFVPMIY